MNRFNHFITTLLLMLATLPLQAQNIADILEYPFEVQYQELAGGQQVAYMDEGEGPPLMLIHGLGSYIPAWQRNIPELSKKYRVIALDLPGFGKSPAAVGEYSIPFFARTVAQLQDSLGIGQAVWIGHSMGGQIALEAAVKYPDKINKLVLSAPAGFEQFSKQEGAMMKQFMTSASIKATPDSLVRKTFRASFYTFSREAQFMVDDRLAIRSAADFNRYANAYAGSVAAMIDGPVLEKLPEIEQPVLVIFGKQDALIPNRQLHPNLTTKQVAESGMRELPNGQLQIINKTGHFVQFEQPEAVNRMILEFLNQ